MEKTHICVPCKVNLCLECYYQDGHVGHEKVHIKQKFKEVKQQIEEKVDEQEKVF